MIHSDSYKTILKPSAEIIFKDKGSKFLGYAYPILYEEQVKEIIVSLKERHHKARHWCYAWKLGLEAHRMRYRVNDDGEPNNSAGQPIYGQIVSKELTNILVVVVRYFGGTKLGMSGLINAYKTAAEMAISASKLVERTIETTYQLNFEYKDLNKVMRVIKEEQLKIIDQKMGVACEILVSIRKNDTKRVKIIFENLHNLQLIEV
ncbi:MAG: YigZ family protein [Flavobacteriaceae bacterium]|nr:YigZ family protein [Flavobacteriaceae bacterium]